MNRRRTNKSAKVPNVKLRPAAPSDRASRNREDADAPPSWARDMGFDSEQEVSTVDLCPRPFQGVVVCATGIEDKTTLFKQALELGALATGDLTDRVTHLLAAEPGSAKYRCALENKIPIMHPDWITESFDIWLKGDDVDLPTSIEKYRLPVFTGVVLCLSGIDDVERRTEINRLVTKNGGKYVKNIERPVRVTHLVCGSANEDQTEKMKYAEKFNQRGEANIQIVWEEWFWDSLDFGGRFDEAAYKASNPRPQRKQLPERATPPRPSSSPQPHSSQSHPQQRRNNSTDLLAAAVNDEEEVASARRVPAEMLAIWGSLLKPRGFEVQAGRLVRSPTRSQPQQPSGGEESPSRTKMERLNVNVENEQLSARMKGRSTSALTLSSFRRANSFAPMSKDKDVMGTRQPFKRAPVGPQTSFLAHPSESSARAGPSRLSIMVPGDKDKEREEEGSEPESSTSTLFKGLKFRALGEAQGPSVKAAIKDYGGTLVSELDEDVDFIIVRLVSGSNFFRQEADEDERRRYRTECWLERCIFDERICLPEEHVAFLPLSVPTPIDGAERIVLSHSGLDQSEACWIRRLARALGATISPNFSRHSTHLLCPSRTGAKAEKAIEWGVPIVDMAWLAALANTGSIPPAQHDADIAPEPPLGVETESAEVDLDLAPPKVDRKGKGKAKDEAEATMSDITNGISCDQSGITSLQHHHSEPGLNTVGTDDVSSGAESFGKPNGLLDTHWNPPATPPPPSRSHSGLTRSASATTISVNSTQILVKDSRAASMAEILPPLPTQRVPSSESPSPLKHPGTASLPTSPTKPGKGAQLALHGSITSLLGKRPSTEDEGSEKGQPTRAGKRARPPSKSKSLSFTNPVSAHAGATVDGFDPEVLSTPSTFTLADAQAAGRGLCVGYDDPGQHAEQRKLMKLFTKERKKEIWDVDGDEVVQAEPTTKPRKAPLPRRRGARAPGF
ncbi:uncharacterized protein B0H18DRAFT_162219 [Fomitopsis serialis]|uniref:uncharacterized protein n=1 Tax=Fomitopsis serialis TaxID=139415 RepID=UPI002007577A|nr:uncharacterized protein B0H18DRAFT_162219 [Neoantrodia serialis]KAH9930122.1 hypothetical protein B0H18DRAFT_162219 [Neoantrodia serialis]